MPLTVTRPRRRGDTVAREGHGAHRLSPPSGHGRPGRATARRRASLLGLGGLLAVTAPAPASAAVVFNGDFETGSLSQYTFVERAYTDRIRVVASPVRQGAHSGRFEVRDGDPLIAGGQRAEIMWGTSDKPTLREGNDYYFGWSTHFASDFPSPSDPYNTGHCNFLQWKNSGTGAPPIAMSCRNGRIQINYNAKCNGWSTPLVRGGWNDFVVRVRFNDDPSLGLIELWHKSPHDASLIKKIDRCSTQTSYSGTTSYLKLGYYRRDDETRTGVVHHDRMRVGTSYADVSSGFSTSPSTPPPTTSTGDTTAPTVTAPAESLPTDQLGTSTLPVRLTWSGAGGVSRYELQRSVAGGTYYGVSLPSATSTSITQQLNPSQGYQYRVRGIDAAGNTSAWSTAARFNLTAHQESSGSVAYDGAWNPQALTGAFGGSVRTQGSSGRRATLSFTGSDVSWVSTQGPDMGRAEVWLDGRLDTTVDLYRPTRSPRETVFSRGGLAASSPHRLEIRRINGKNPSSTGTRVDVDAFGVIR